MTKYPVSPAIMNIGASGLSQKNTTQKIMKKVMFCALTVGALTMAAQAANITWQTPQTISGTSDVSLDGTLFGTWAPGDDWGGTSRSDYYPVNGVTFAAYGSGANYSASGSSMDRYGSYADPNTADPNYNFLMQTAEFNWNSDPITVSWDSMVVGNTYEVEVWANDGRGLGRSETINAGDNSVDLNMSPAAGGPGQYAIGTFMADSTTQSFTLTPDGSYGGQINLLQLRTLDRVHFFVPLHELVLGLG
jgi:hypothetical protein